MSVHTLKKIFISSFLGLAFFCVWGSPAQALDTTDIELLRASEATPQIFHVEIAKSPAELEKGLMGRTALAPDSGMIFIFPNEQMVSFWMKNTLIPLDMLFIKGSGEIAQIHAMATPQDLTPIPSQEPVRYVLEIAGGSAAKFNLNVGDHFSFLAQAEPEQDRPALSLGQNSIE